MSNDITTLKSALLPANFEQVLRFAELVKDTEFVPKDFRGRPGHIVAAITYGAELGLSPMQALNSMACINGRPALFGDGLLATCMGHPQWAGMDESISGDGDKRTAQCTVRRTGGSIVVRTVSMADTKRAGLASKPIWGQYPDRMMQMRARGFALRDAFADALKGIVSQAEADDIPRDVTTPTQVKANAETRRRAMEEIEAVEVISVYGEPHRVMPVELPAWIAAQLDEPVDSEALTNWQDNNDGVPRFEEIVTDALKGHAKPNGSGATQSFVVFDHRGKTAGTFDTLEDAIAGLRLALQSMAETDANSAVALNKRLLEQSQSAKMAPALGKWAGDQLDWLNS